MDHGPPEQPEYLTGWLSDRLAEDGDVHELGITVRVAGDAVFLGGTVSTGERRDVVGRRAGELVPHLRVCNEIVVASYAEPVAEESLA
jgi:osmotically-inducible protein OsmY